jgi:hypothetical protein
VIRRLLGMLLLLGIAGAAAGQETDGFRIESITVDGGRREATAAIVVEESRLTAGRVWTERELREAVYRIRRLPFIVRADFALRRGTARGLYALAITVEETRPFFFSRQAELVSTSPERVSFALGYGLSGGVNLRNSGTAGARLFVGSRNVLFGSADINEGLQAGYSRYGLFGRGGSLTVSLAHHTFCCNHEVLPLALDPAFVTWSTESGDTGTLSIVLPLTGNQSLRAAASLSRRDAASRRSLLDDPGIDAQTFFSGERRETRQAEIKWLYDTADDPLFPTQGFTLSGGVELTQQTVPVRTAGQTIFDRAALQSDSRLVALAATARRSWPLTPRQAVSVGGRLAVGRSTIDHLVLADGSAQGAVDLNSVETAVEARYSASLWGFEKTRDHGDLRAEMVVRAGYETVSPAVSKPLTQISLGPSIAFRNGWGIFRAAFTYLNLQRSRR